MDYEDLESWLDERDERVKKAEKKSKELYVRHYIYKDIVKRLDEIGLYEDFISATDLLPYSERDLIRLGKFMIQEWEENNSKKG